MDAKADYDPSSVSPSARPSKLRYAMTGMWDPKKMPPDPDPAVETRVEVIGEKLIPKYQRELPNSDPDKIHFRFQVVDRSPKVEDALALPNGIILIPRHVVDRMQNDTELATVLADNIACVLEKQDVRMKPGNTALAAMGWAGVGGGAVVPGLDLATSAVVVGVGSSRLRRTREQSGRVSLDLLHDAGYDIREAPMAWWVLGSKHPKAKLKLPPPERAQYLYRMLGSTWAEELNSPSSITGPVPGH